MTFLSVIQVPLLQSALGVLLNPSAKGEFSYTDTDNGIF